MELLNANQSCGALRMLPSVGGNPVTYLLTDVVDLAMRGITVLEAATTTNRTVGSTFHLIKSRSVGVVADKLYCLEQLRAKAPELLS